MNGVIEIEMVHETVYTQNEMKDETVLTHKARYLNFALINLYYHL